MKRIRKAYRVIFWGLMLLLPWSLYGQDDPVNILTKPKLAGEWYIPEPGYYGSQLFRNEWFRGDVFLENGRTAHDKTLAYNVVQDALIWLDGKGGKVIRLDKGLISGFLLRDDRGIERHFKKIRVRPSFSKDTVPVFLQVLYEGEQLSLYAQRKIEDYYSKMYGGTVSDVSATLEPRPVYYLFVEGVQHVRMQKIRRKELLMAFPPEKQQIKKILRKQHISVRNEDQLIKAVELIEPIIRDL